MIGQRRGDTRKLREKAGDGGSAVFDGICDIDLTAQL